jgi:hypothetical protein
MNMRAAVTITAFSLFGFSEVAAFQVAPSSTAIATTSRHTVQVAPLDATSRRSFVETAAVGAVAAILTASSNVLPAAASGGATAGGAYLLSAKQRYNERVKAGVKGFLSIQTALKNSDIPTLRTYFNSEDVGSWIDLTAAGYLLANAFRTTSNKAPDALPSVKVGYTSVCCVDLLNQPSHVISSIL